MGVEARCYHQLEFNQFIDFHDG